MAIGSVLPLPTPSLEAIPDASVWAHWTAGYRHTAAFSSARAALAALLALYGVKRLWLPAYACTALADGGARCLPLWYGADRHLNPDVAALAQDLRAKDAVLAIDYFGRPAGTALRDLARDRHDVLWIQDRAQALAPGDEPWAKVVLYSPRKLIGVADGGILVSNGSLPVPHRPTGDRSMAAQIARAADPGGHHPELWFPAFQNQEAAFLADGSAMLRETGAVLQGIAWAPLAAARTANAGVLAQALPDLALWPGHAMDFAPLAFPIRVAGRDALAKALAANGIYCARHWPDLPSDPGRFPMEHLLSQELLSLPCDHRYGAQDMDRIVAAVRGLGAQPAGARS